MNMSTPPTKSRDLYGRDEPCGIARTAWNDQFSAARERYRKTSPVKRTTSMEGAPSVRDRMKSFTQQNPDAASDLVRHTSSTRKSAHATAPVVSPSWRDNTRRSVPAFPPQHEAIPAKKESEDEVSVSASSSSCSSSSSSEAAILGRINTRKKKETAPTTKKAETTEPCAYCDNDSCRKGATKATSNPAETSPAHRSTYSSNSSAKALEPSSEPVPVSNSICVSSPSKSRDLYGRDEPCGIARTGFDDQFAAARERYKKTPVKRTPSMEGTMSLRDRMKSFTQQPPETKAGPINASPVAKSTTKNETLKVHEALDNFALGVKGTKATSSSILVTRMTTSTSSNDPAKNEYSDEVSVSSEEACHDNEDSSCSPYSSYDDSSSLSEEETPRQSLSTFEAKCHDHQSKQAKEANVSSVDVESPIAPNKWMNTYSYSSPMTSTSEQTMPSEPVSNCHLIGINSPHKSRDLYGRDEPCGIARTGFDDQFAAARERYKKTPVKRTPSMEGTMSLRDRMKSFTG